MTDLLRVCTTAQARPGLTFGPRPEPGETFPCAVAECSEILTDDDAINCDWCGADYCEDHARYTEHGEGICDYCEGNGTVNEPRESHP